MTTQFSLLYEFSDKHELGESLRNSTHVYKVTTVTVDAEMHRTHIKIAEQSRFHFSHLTNGRCCANDGKSSVLFISVLNHSDCRHLGLPSQVRESVRSLLHYRPGINVHHVCPSLHREL
jgi:hypothetical protein